MKKLIQNKSNKLFAGFLVIITILSSMLQPTSVYAAELESMEDVPTESPEVVQSEASMVTAHDITVEVGSDFQVEVDFTGIDIPEDGSVKVTFAEAKNASGEAFHTNHEDMFQAVYYVEPVNGQAAYTVSRNIYVRNVADVVESGAGAEAVTGGDNSSSDMEEEEADSDSDTNMATTEDVTEKSSTEAETSKDECAVMPLDYEVTGTTHHIWVGEKIQYPASVGNYYTNYFTVDGSIAYCLQSADRTPATGTYDHSFVMEHDTDLIWRAAAIKVLYYGYGGPGDITEQYFGSDVNVRYAMTHIAVSYAYTEGNEDIAFDGCNRDGLEAIGLMRFLGDVFSMSLPPIDGTIGLSSYNPAVTYDGSQYVSEEIMLYGAEGGSATMTIPEGVTYHNISTGATQTGGSVKVVPAQKFYFTAPSSVSGIKELSVSSDSNGMNVQVLVVFTDATQDVGKVMWSEGSKNSVTMTLEFLAQDSEVKLIKQNTAGEPLAGAVYGIYADADCTDLITTLTSGADGTATAILPASYGTVYAKEITAPQGYILSEEIHTVVLVAGEQVSFTAVDEKQLAKLVICKNGEVVAGFDKDFQYESVGLSGAVFEVYKDDALVEIVMTDATGKAVLENLPFGTYRVVEVVAPDGFVWNPETKEVILAQTEQEATIVTETVIFENDRQKVEIQVVKKDAETKETLAGAVLGLYAAENIKDCQDNVLVEAGTLLTECTTGVDGKAEFALDLPLGQYVIKELKAPEGYVLSGEALEVDPSYQGQEVTVIQIAKELENYPTTMAIRKTDITSGEPLDGAKLTVLDMDGNMIDSWISSKDEAHFIKGLEIGKDYILREETAPYGYLLAEEITFTVADTVEVQTVEMQDNVPTGSLVIHKQGEFLEQVTPVDTTDEQISHLFQYESGPLQDVVFELYALEDIKAADGVSAVYYKKDELVATIHTDSSGVARLEDLPLGKYYVKEKKTKEGYAMDGEIHVVDLSYQDQETAVVTYSENWNNARMKVQVSVVKAEKDTAIKLEGAVFALYAAEDILDSAGNVLLKADTVIEERTTDENGELTFEADLPYGYSYYVKEVMAPAGYVTNGEKQQFSFKVQNSDESAENFVFEFLFENEPTVVEITKTDIAGEEVPGAVLTILDKNGNAIECWTSTEGSHYIKKLPVGKYILHEETAPLGYLVAEDIWFEVTDTGEIQKVVMVNVEEPEPPEEPDEPEAVEVIEIKQVPETGDDSDITLWLVTGSVGLVGMVVVLLVWKWCRKKCEECDQTE